MSESFSWRHRIDLAGLESRVEKEQDEGEDLSVRRGKCIRVTDIDCG